MASRRDLFQSYQFMIQRVISSVVLRETDPPQTPMRRMGGAGVASVMIAILALAIAGIIGLVNPGGSAAYQNSEVVIVEEETGAVYVWFFEDDDPPRLFPVTNFASAALIVGSTATEEVSRASLADAPRGPRLGIVDAPASLPDPERMLGDPLTLCSLPAETISGAETPNTALVVGEDISQGSLVGDAAVLVRDIQTGTLHYVWAGSQYPIPREEPVLEGLTLRLAPQIEVGTAWLNALPTGQDLVPQPVAGRGAPSAAVPGALVGEVRVVESAGDRQYYQVGASRISEITEVQSQLLLADPRIADAYPGQRPQALPLSAAEANAADRVELPNPAPTDPPARQPATAEVSGATSTLCASFADNEATPRIAVDAAVEGAGDAAVTARVTPNGTVLADRVNVAPGFGAVVEAVISPDAPRGIRFLITDDGYRFALANPGAQAALGYAETPVIRMPESLIDRIPEGDALDPEEALRRAPIL